MTDVNAARPGGDVSLVPVRRGFVDVAEGQVHYRECGHGAAADAPVLVMLHASPGSAKMLEPLMVALSHGRRVVALDTLGNGDSSPSASAEPAIGYFADGHRRALDALGIGRFDLYGTHTGASIAVELTLQDPQRVRRLILDGMSLYSAEQRADMLQNYARPVEVDLNGSQLNHVWHFSRDAFLFWPWYRRDAQHLRAVGLPSAQALHDKVVEVLKSVHTFHLPYNAAIAYDKAPRLPLLTAPTLLACSRDDMLMEYFDDLRGLMPSAQWLVTTGGGAPETWAERIAGFRAFLEDAP